MQLALRDFLCIVLTFANVVASSLGSQKGKHNCQLKEFTIFLYTHQIQRQFCGLSHILDLPERTNRWSPQLFSISSQLLTSNLTALRRPERCSVFRSIDALTDDKDLIPRTSITSLTIPCNFIFMNLDTLFWPSGVPTCTYNTQPYRQHTHTYT